MITFNEHDGYANLEDGQRRKLASDRTEWLGHQQHNRGVLLAVFRGALYATAAGDDNGIEV